jgi:predicted permease
VATFFTTFFIVFKSIGMILMIALIAAIMARHSVISENGVKQLSDITIKLLLPCFIFASIVGNLDIEKFPDWWVIPILAITTLGIGLVVSFVVFYRKRKSHKYLIPLSAMMNTGYFILPLGKVIYPDDFDHFSLYVSLYILGSSPVIWSIGKLLMTEQSEKPMKMLKGAITPPLMATILAVFVVLSGTRQYVSGFVLDSATMVGQATVPLATIILGATLGHVDFRERYSFKDLTHVVFIRLLIIPAIIFIAISGISILHVYPNLGDVIIIESASPAATALVLQAQSYGGNQKSTGIIMFASYILCIITVPFWLALWLAPILKNGML